MLSSDEVVEISEAEIKLAAKTKNHPYNIITEAIQLFDYSDEDTDIIFNLCKSYLKGKEQELPWVL